jgi:tRNA threonylcarbamoyladenosine biosynthesis protein TsaB
LLVLGIDTATAVGSVGLIDARPECAGAGGAAAENAAPQIALRAEISRAAGLAHGAALLPMIEECLATAGVAAPDLDGVAVSIGPGSFTGLRVGLATAKGLVFGTSIALIGVPTLEGLAEAFARDPGQAAEPRPAIVCACLDARKGEVYAALFSPASQPPSGGGLFLRRLTEDRAESAEALTAAVERQLAGETGTADSPSSSVVFLGDGAERYRAVVEGRLGARARILPSAVVHPRGGIIAALGAARIAAGQRDDLASLAPAYARLSEAEKARAARSGASEAPEETLTSDLRGA